MNLAYAYNKLFSNPGYSFVVTPDGIPVDWGSNFMQSKGLQRNTPTVIHLIPGSFNPLHQTHKEIFSLVKAPKEHSFFEMSIERVDKDAVTFSELELRLKQFQNYAPVIVSRAPRFITKIGTYLEYLDNLTFHVGIDTISRMINDYGAIGIQGLAATFVVYERIMHGQHLNLKTEFGMRIPRNCIPNSINRSVESLTRSSSEIRRSQSKL